MFEHLKATPASPGQNGIDVGVEQAIVRITQPARGRTYPIAPAVLKTFGVVALLGGAGYLLTVQTHHAATPSPKHAAVAVVNTSVARPQRSEAPVLRSSAVGTASPARHVRPPRPTHAPKAYYAFRAVEAQPRPAIKPKPKPAGNRWIAEPLQGEALRLALIEDHRRTRALNDAVLSAMRPR